MEAKEVESLLKKIRQLKADSVRALGRLDTLKAQLKAEFGVTSLGEAREHLADLRATHAEIESQVEAAMEEFAHEYPDLVDA